MRISSALEALAELKERGDPVALLLSDHRMPQMQGVELLGRARALYPQAKRVLLTAYADTEAAIAAINESTQVGDSQAPVDFRGQERVLRQACRRRLVGDGCALVDAAQGTASDGTTF